ncbi:MAG: hypothetical protein KGY66_00875 [Candidatus Thermoplasmatota archaeon]|nr:hypothetical protein [Candidatus Thermoplasmatota archaeon]MBS3789454.1 hypothetical protein [Candidatus Thermoplasmatota archaeon]
MDRDGVVGIAKAGMWLLTTLWFGYMSAIMLWHIDKTTWMITMDFNYYGEAIFEMPIFFISTVWLVLQGTKQASIFLDDNTDIPNKIFKHLP